MIKDFETSLKKMNLIYFKSRHSFEIYKSISIQSDLSNPLLVHLMYVAFNDSIIGLEKLFSRSESQRFRILKLLNNLKKNGGYNSLEFDVDCIEKWEKRLLEFKQILDLIKNLRDKHFAHTDNDDSYGLNTSSIDYRNVVDNSKIEHLFDFTKEVMIKVYRDCGLGMLDLDLIFTEDNLWDLIDVRNSR
ncbi:MAG: hypothetical protein R3182_06130 [Draconibacterium sp.]|uniref:AbiU2 domain-containing protein n=1 Tax=Cyclobacterium marinum TaxID=104 RepID=UPI0011EEF8EE|nr:hypothetical protein [Cyclobacterium marinum]MBI0401700.1 hypothetical protein [Cyclobacterium marinum]MDX1284566.1 hypothetical protein [Draconibacterium sp.]